jgi:hypothetical protein
MSDYQSTRLVIERQSRRFSTILGGSFDVFSEFFIIAVHDLSGGTIRDG